MRIVTEISFWVGHTAKRNISLKPSSRDDRLQMALTQEIIRKNLNSAKILNVGLQP